MDSTVIRCEICCELFHPNMNERKPRVLRCGHTFCTNCLNELFKTSKLCPTDRKEFDFDSVENLPVNFSVLKIPSRSWHY